MEFIEALNGVDGSRLGTSGQVERLEQASAGFEGFVEEGFAIEVEEVECHESESGL